MDKNDRRIILLFCTFVYFVSLQRTAAISNQSDSSICSNHCSQQDSDASCWNGTERYYDETLIKTVNDWLSVQINIDQWHKRKGLDDSTLNSSETVVNRMSKYLTPGRILDSDHLQQILTTLLNLSYTQSSSIPASGKDMPEFVCPTPCGYESQLWQYLFIASILINIAMLLVVIPFIIKSERRDKKLYAKQVNMVQMLKPASKSRNPSAS